MRNDSSRVLTMTQLMMGHEPAKVEIKQSGTYIDFPILHHWDWNGHPKHKQMKNSDLFPIEISLVDPSEDGSIWMIIAAKETANTVVPFSLLLDIYAFNSAYPMVVRVKTNYTPGNWTSQQWPGKTIWPWMAWIRAHFIFTIHPPHFTKKKKAHGSELPAIHVHLESKQHTDTFTHTYIYI